VPVESVLEILEQVPPASSELPAPSASPAAPILPAPQSNELLKEIRQTRKLLVALQEEIDKCVEWETKGLLKQKQLHAQLRLDKVLNVLCGEVPSEPMDVDGPVTEIIAQLETERNNLLHEINSLKNQLVTGSTGTPTPPSNNLDYQFEPVVKVEELKAGDCIRISAPNRDLKFGDVVVEITDFGEIKTSVVWNPKQQRFGVRLEGPRK
jgi:hypothetical protein